MKPFDSPRAEFIAALRGVMTRIPDPVHVLSLIVDQAVRLTDADRGVFVEVDRHGHASFRVLRSFSPVRESGSHAMVDGALFQQVLRSGGKPIIANSNVHSRTTAGGGPGARASLLSVPIRSNGTIAAFVLQLESHRPEHFTERHGEALGWLFEVAAPLLEIVETRQRTARGLTAEPHEAPAREWSFDRLVGDAPAFRTLENTARRVARTDLPILIEGETGTGKGVIARVIHNLGPRATQPFVTLFCPSLEKGTVETELFGHRRGAFTGATADRIGKVQAAEHGTLFLDEVGDLPLDIQPKLLRLLHERTFERLGDPREYRADVRVIAATNKELEAEVGVGAFRRDLYERLRFVVLRVPPLRERKQDLPLLLRRALDLQEEGKRLELSVDAARGLVESRYPWPGNVREVEQLGARLVLSLHPDRPIRWVDIEHELGRHDAAIAGDTKPVVSLPDLVESAERDLLVRALRENPGLSREHLAAKLCISERCLYKKLRTFGLR